MCFKLTLNSSGESSGKFSTLQRMEHQPGAEDQDTLSVKKAGCAVDLPLGTIFSTERSLYGLEYENYIQIYSFS